MTDKPVPLFVYGTLRSDGGQAHLLGDRRRGPAWVHGTLYALPAGYPALSLTGEGVVHGEWVMPVPDALLGLLDHYEGVHEGLYRRVLVDVHAGSRKGRAWAWVMDRPDRQGGRPIPSGRWRAARRR